MLPRGAGDDAPNLYTIGELTAPVRSDALSSTGVVTDFSIMSVVMQASQRQHTDRWIGPTHATSLEVGQCSC